MPLVVAILLQVAGVVGAAWGLWVLFGWAAALVLVASVVFYVGVELERR